MTEQPSNLTLIMLSVILLAMSSAGCSQDRQAAEPVSKANNISDLSKDTKMKIKMGSKVFAATLYDSETAEAFRKLLPLTIEMGDFNGNEKDHKFSTSLPTESAKPKMISSGDLM